MNFINQFCFSEPLDDVEANNVFYSVLKSSKEDEEIRPDEKDPIEIAIKFAKLYDVHLYKNQLYFKELVELPGFKQTYKFTNNLNLLKRTINNLVKLSTAKLNEVISQLYLYSKLVKNENFVLKCRNGIITEKGQFLNIVEEIPFTPFYLDVEYNEAAECKELDNFIHFFGQKKEELVKFLIEMFGHLIMINNKPPILLFMVGDGSNGKSTFFEMLTEFLGDLSSHISLDGFNDATSVSTLIGKLGNIADDIDPEYVEKSQILKTMATGNTISVRPAYNTELVTIKNTATLMFTCNELPIFKDKTGGMKRRVKIYNCDAKLEDKDKDPFLLNKITTDEAKSYLLKLAVLGMQSILNNNGKFTKSEILESQTHNYFIESDNVEQYIQEYEIDEDYLDYKKVKDVYDEYVFYCVQSGYKPISVNNFSKKMCKDFQVISKVIKSSGKTSRTFIKQ